ncbi:hypothetical protein ACQKPX_02670 [Photobacterium sp. DNB23_23_1]|uniref:Uncharacterized protein n=1 Tax=Photobacterium pectinilyticum TaxID=2906793 RepID=A0ABT1N148_9GAMM|nr:hypothetical protein [Photobacterium sp. ZSDE20]MCQ1058462.1 hypothetical protein [Photobacterium sp. ZSDE20]MDD1823185.1 hypothetical protein [Photobacterium sp. ZSDE20]
MKKLIGLLVMMLFSFSVQAGGGSGTGGIPSIPCVIDGKLIHKHLQITECNELKKEATDQKAKTVY